MTTQEFLLEMRRLDVEIWLEDDRLRCSAPSGVLTVERRAELARRRPEIEAFLRGGRISSAIVPIETDGPKAPFYAVPGHNGDVFCFVALARALGAERPFYGLTPSGLDDERSWHRIEDLAAHLVAELIERQPSGPYQLGGYCLGGLTAFEMAQQLRAAGREVSTVVLFGTMSPPALRPFNRARAVAAEWAANRKDGLRRLMTLPPRERLRSIARKAAHAAGAGAAPPPDDFTRRRLALEAATVAAAYRYRPAPYEGRLALFIANDAAARSLDRPLEWAGYARGAFDVFKGSPDCDGDSMLKPIGAGVIAPQLARYLDTVAAPTATRALA